VPPAQQLTADSGAGLDIATSSIACQGKFHCKILAFGCRTRRQRWASVIIPGSLTVGWPFANWLRLIVRPLVPTAAAFVGGGDRYRSTVLRDARYVTRPRVTTPVSRRRLPRPTCSGCSKAGKSAIPQVCATTRSSCWSHASACDRSRRRGCSRTTSTGAPGGSSCEARRPARAGCRCPPMSGRR
jgi:hypothetical protein